MDEELSIEQKKALAMASARMRASVGKNPTNLLDSTSLRDFVTKIGESPLGQTVGAGISNAQDAMGNIVGMVSGTPYKEVVPTPDLDTLRQKGFSATSWPQIAGAAEESLLTSPPGKMLGMAMASPQAAIIGTSINDVNQKAEQNLGIPHQYSQAAEMALPFVPKGAINAVREGMGEAPPLSVPKSEFDPLAYHQSIGGEYSTAKFNAGKYYDFMENLAEGKPAENTQQIGQKLNTIIEDISSDPLHEGRSQLGKLKMLSDKIESGDFGLPDAVDLKKTVNTYFNPKRLSQATKDSPYLRLNSVLDNSLAKSGDIYPDFGMSRELADKNWLNTVKKPFESNPVLNKFWKPEDYYNHNGVENGTLDYLPDETAQRAASLVKNIKTPQQLDAITRIAPDDQAVMLRQAKLDELSGGRGRLAAAGKTIVGSPNLTLTGMAKTAKNIGDVIKPSYTPEEIALIKATKQPSPRLSNDYANQFEELQNFVDQPRMSMANQQAGLPSPPQRLALAAPQIPIAVDAYGTAKTMTPMEYRQHVAGKGSVVPTEEVYTDSYMSNRIQDVFTPESTVVKSNIPPNPYADIGNKFEGMDSTSRMLRLQMLDKKMQAGIITPQEMAERLALSEKKFARGGMVSHFLATAKR